MSHFGKYRGKVENNVDPLQMGRVQVSCPAVLGSGKLAWAMPCVPYAGDGVGFFAVPPVGANVWVEFEGGDPDYPILGGCFWGQGETPVPSLPMPFIKAFHTDAAKFTIDETPGKGSVTLEVAAPISPTTLKIVLDKLGIDVDNGTNNLNLGMVSVSINKGNLEVLP